jgi:hypothetical protein
VGKMEWRRPTWIWARRGLVGMFRNVEHRSCVDCGHFETTVMTNKRCALDHDRIVYFGPIVGEVRFRGSGRTLADKCGDYEMAPELFQGRVLVTEKVRRI